MLLILLFQLFSVAMTQDDLPSLYEYYTAGGVFSGLDDSTSNFILNGKEITIFSGALHYFRVPSEYWRDRLRKFRAAGLNTVETYVPWNLHEPENGTFDFGTGSSDFSEFLDIVKFLKLAQEEDLLVILRPGPYICAEWEFGGLPSWLLRHNGIKVRTSDPTYMKYVERYYKNLMELVKPLQFSKGGPIIAFQIENEYGNTRENGKPVDTAYLEALRKIMKDNGIKGLFFTSDTPSNGFSGTVPGALATANFQNKPVYELTLLKEHQPNKPLMVMEYWSGWFDHWTENHHTRSADEFAKALEEIVNFNSSFNLYMMHGGTNWGFMNGANLAGSASDNDGYQPDISSYDYDAPLTENGDYTSKYQKLREITAKYSNLQLRQPEAPKIIKPVAYEKVEIVSELPISDLVDQTEHSVRSDKVIPMELLDINNHSGQSYGYVVYTKHNIDIPANSVLKIEGRVCDSVMVLINDELKSKVLENENDLNDFGYWKKKDSTLVLGDKEYRNATLRLVVENWGRVNYGKLYQFNQHKGLWQGNILLNSNIISEWVISPLEFKKKWTSALKNWKPVSSVPGPKLYRTVLNVEDPVDTFLDMRGWNKGFVVVNGFVLARYCRLGPQLFAYLPAPLLKKGHNEIHVFEHFVPSSTVKFSAEPIYGKF